MTGDEDSGVEAVGGDVVRFFLETGIVPSLVQLKVLMERTTYACIISSLLPFWEVPLYTTFAMASNSSMPPPMNVDASYYISDVNGIRKNLDGLQKYCMMCQKRLDKLFGPLEANGPVTLNDMLNLEG